MSFFDTPNPDANVAAPGAVATGPLEGFLANWETSVDLQMRTSSMYGIEFFMHGLDWEQTQALREAGVNDPPHLMASLDGSNEETGTSDGYYGVFDAARSRGYLDVARRYNGESIGEEFEERLTAYDARVLKLREERPDLKLRTSREMFGEVKRKAQEVERRDQTGRRSWGGEAGAFLGGALASLHPDTDPLNFLTLGVGGVGKTALMRIGAQGVGQGAIEAVNQATGVQEQRRLQGLSTGLADAAQRVAFAAAGGAALQGVGEGAVAIGKRWFRNTPSDPAPPRPTGPRAEVPAPRPQDLPAEAKVARLEADPSTLPETLAAEASGGSRSVAARSRLDISDMTAQLEAWNGPNAVGAKPKAAFQPEGRQGATGGFDSLAVAALDKAQRTEEAAERAFEFATARMKDSDPAVTKAIQAMEDAADALRARPDFKFSKDAQAELKTVEADINRALELAEPGETVQVSKARRQLTNAKRKTRAARELNQRAERRAKGEWDAAPEPKPEAQSTPVFRAVEAVKPDEVKATLDELDAAIDQLTADAKAMVAAEDGLVQTGVPDVTLKLSDQIFIEGADGNAITVKQALEELDSAKSEMEGVVSCSIR